MSPKEWAKVLGKLTDAERFFKDAYLPGNRCHQEALRVALLALADEDWVREPDWLRMRSRKLSPSFQPVQKKHAYFWMWYPHERRKYGTIPETDKYYLAYWLPGRIYKKIEYKEDDLSEAGYKIFVSRRQEPAWLALLLALSKE